MFCANLLNDEIVSPEAPKKVKLNEPETIYANGVIISWSLAKDDDFAGYQIYYDTTSQVSPVKSMHAGHIYNRQTTQFQFSNLCQSTTYYVRVFVFNKATYSGSNTRSFTTPTCTCGVFTDERDEGMVRIPAGCFIGKDKSIASISYDYFIDTTEITASHWFKVVHDSVVSSNKPMVGISWLEAILFCNKKSKQQNLDTCYTYTSITIDTSTQKPSALKDLKCSISKNGYRIPTEDEWEYAYRSGQWEEYHWGKDGNTLPEPPWTSDYPTTIEDTMEICEYAWWTYNNKDTLNWYPGLKDVALLKPNPWSLYDIAGNVDEFIWDLFSDDRPQNRLDYTGPEYGPQSGSMRFIRGGNYVYRYLLLAAWYRFNSVSPDDATLGNVGLRTVRTIDD